jgi:hypothetical protein
MIQRAGLVTDVEVNQLEIETAVIQFSRHDGMIAQQTLKRAFRWWLSLNFLSGSSAR